MLKAYVARTKRLVTQRSTPVIGKIVSAPQQAQLRHTASRARFDAHMREQLGGFYQSVDPGPMQPTDVSKRTAAMEESDVDALQSRNTFFDLSYRQVQLFVDALAAQDVNLRTIGSVLAITGNGSFYGKTMGRGMDLAVKHIKAAGGPDIKIIYKDHKSGEPQAGVQAMTELGTAGVPAKLASYGDDILAMLPLTQQYKCLTLDGGGGNGGAGQSQDFFWGTRALTAIDPIPGMLKYLADAFPDAKTIGTYGWDLGAKNNDDYKTIFTKAIAGSKLQLNGLWELAAPNSTDFSNVLTKNLESLDHSML